MRRFWSRPVSIALAWLLALGLGLRAPVPVRADDQAPAPTAQPAEQQSESEQPAEEKPKAEEPAPEAAAPEPAEPANGPTPSEEPGGPVTDADTPDDTSSTAPADESSAADPAAPAGERSQAARSTTSFGRSGFVTGATTTYTHADGETVTYNAEVPSGRPIRLAGTGWLAKPDRVDEGEEGSVIGVKLIDPAVGQLSRKSLVVNPRLGTPIANATVWGAVWADSQGDFELELDWPDASSATGDPGWEAGDSFTVQLLSGTLYSDQAGVDPSQRPDVSRTVALTVTVVEAASDPVPAAPEV
ncbi:MAG: hypothetical protein KIT69_17945, partial [Propionibacteriaceae bacterium]|nr:hypothetical protein [Propionibacteriaceae bacterium]